MFPLLQEWGYDVEILHSNIDYLDSFNHIISRSKHTERNGKKRGFPLGGMCAINRDCKIKPIKDYLKKFDSSRLVQYVGIAIDEPKRLKRLEGTNKVSLLERYEYTEQMAYDLCKEYDMLSPIYSESSRGGCWFCPNSRIFEFANVKKYNPELWEELRELSKDSMLVSKNFKYSQTFEDVDRQVDEYIRKNG